MWVTAAVVLLVSIGGTVAQPLSGDLANQPKKILLLHSYGPNFSAVGHVAQGDRP